MVSIVRRPIPFVQIQGTGDSVMFYSPIRNRLLASVPKKPTGIQLSGLAGGKGLASYRYGMSRILNRGHGRIRDHDLKPSIANADGPSIPTSQLAWGAAPEDQGWPFCVPRRASGGR
jgi:hypothetical protein